MKWEEKNLPMTQETSNDVSWAFYSFGLPPSHRLPSSHRSVVVLFGLVAVLMFSRRFVVAGIHPMSSCSLRCLGVLPWSCEWLLLLSWCQFIVVLVSIRCCKSKPIRNEKYKLVEGKMPLPFLMLLSLPLLLSSLWSSSSSLMKFMLILSLLMLVWTWVNYKRQIVQGWILGFDLVII